MRTVTYRARAYKLRAWRAQYAIAQSIDIRILVCDKEWQLLRESLLGTWARHHDSNVLRLRAFIEGSPAPPILGLPCPTRTRIVYNYITGTWFRVRMRGSTFDVGSYPALYQLLTDIRALVAGEEAVIS